MGNRKHLKELLFLFIAGTVVITILLNFAGLSESIEAIKLADKRLFLLAIMVQFILLLIRPWRWDILLRDINERIAFKNLFVLTVIGTFMNDITPGARLGGEPIRAYLLNRNFNVKIGKGLATVVVERIFDFFIFTAIAIVSYLYVIFAVGIERQNKIIITVFMLIMILILSGVIKAIFSESIAKRILGFLPSKFKTRFMETFWMFRISSVDLVRGGNTFIAIMFLTTLLWFFEILRPFILFHSLNTPVPLLVVALITTLSLFLATIPILPGGLGTVEGVMVGLYIAMNIPIHVCVVVTLLDRLISFWLMILFGGTATAVTKIQNIKA
jgi:hypothetical protein